MKIFAPDYYNSFKCIAEKCQHNCCIGWDVEIDSDTLDTYLNMSGEFADKLKKNISYIDESPCFRLNDKKRCPFLKENGLCEIILEIGEENICDICTDHPRFRNFFSDREEIGLGLCCEEAARIILKDDYKFSLKCIEENNEQEAELDDVEKHVLSVRKELFGIFDNDYYDYSNCRYEISRIIDREIPIFTNEEIGEIFLPLEMLEKSWGSLIKIFSENTCVMPKICNKYSEFSKRLLHYFIFRHFAGAIDDGRIYERTVLAILSTEVIVSLADSLSGKKLDVDTLCDIARRYSSEIEYSDENIDIILDFITEKMQ